MFGSNKAKSFFGEIIVNVIVTSLLELACNVIPVVGSIIGGFIIGFASIKTSSMEYLKTLEIVHSGNLTERYNY